MFSLFSRITNWFNPASYRSQNDAVIIACYYNPKHNPYRLAAFKTWYKTVKHLNLRIIELTVKGSSRELAGYDHTGHVQHIESASMLWHKEALLNRLIEQVAPDYKYIFWLDTDVIFTNRNWLREACKRMENGAQMVQPFAYAIRLEEGETKPSFDISNLGNVYMPNRWNNAAWRSFCCTYIEEPELAASDRFNDYGHTGFAWGATSELLTQCPLFDRALIGSADNVIAQGAVGKFHSPLMRATFKYMMPSITAYQRRLFSHVLGLIDYVPGNLYHIWHGDHAKRRYLKRNQDFDHTLSQINRRDANGLYMAAAGQDEYVNDYMEDREVAGIIPPVYGEWQNNLAAGSPPPTAPDPASWENVINMQPPVNESPEFGGGEFGGGGAGGEYTEENIS